MWRVIQMHSSIYPIDATHVGLVGILLTGMTITCFAPLEYNSPLLDDFDGFIKKIQASFGI